MPPNDPAATIPHPRAGARHGEITQDPDVLDRSSAVTMRAAQRRVIGEDPEPVLTAGRPDMPADDTPLGGDADFADAGNTGARCLRQQAMAATAGERLRSVSASGRRRYTRRGGNTDGTCGRGPPGQGILRLLRRALSGGHH